MPPHLWPWQPQKPGLVADPLFEHELALRLHMPVGELHERMSLHELTVQWPAFFAFERRKAAERAREEERQARRIR